MNNQIKLQLHAYDGAQYIIQVRNQGVYFCSQKYLWIENIVQVKSQGWYS